MIAIDDGQLTKLLLLIAVVGFPPNIGMVFALVKLPGVWEFLTFVGRFTTSRGVVATLVHMVELVLGLQQVREILPKLIFVQLLLLLLFALIEVTAVIVVVAWLLLVVAVAVAAVVGAVVVVVVVVMLLAVELMILIPRLLLLMFLRKNPEGGIGPITKRHAPPVLLGLAAVVLEERESPIDLADETHV